MINQIKWAAPEYVWLLPVVILAVILVIYRMQLKQRTALLLAGKWSDLVIKNYSPFRNRIKSLLLAVGIICLWISLLRPQWEKREETIAQEGRDLLIGLDISRSMLATDCVPNRLTMAKTKIKRLLNLFECERVGLLLFSGSAFVQCPLTTDYNAFLMYLDHVDAETISSGTTALDRAIAMAIDTYQEVPNKKTKLLVLFTDGEDFSHNLTSCKKKAQEEGLHVFTIGVGTSEGAPIPLYNEAGKQIGHQKDGKGNVVISQLNQAVLQGIAKEVGGSYIQITSDNSDIKILVSQIVCFEKEAFEEKKISQLKDKYHYFLILSFLCFIGE